jgi:hypothetical protein
VGNVESSNCHPWSKCGPTAIISCQYLLAFSYSVVAVHGLCETLDQAWTDLDTNTLWLRDLLPTDLHCARILSFGYAISPSMFFSPGGGRLIGGLAETLVQSLNTRRSLHGAEERPKVFVCHGLGGVIVKQALIYASHQTSDHVQHLYGIYVSTFALLLFGVPTTDLEESPWLDYEALMCPTEDVATGHGQHVIRTQLTAKHMLRDLNSTFAHLLKQFWIYYFWEGLKTSLGGFQSFLVDETSAAPMQDNTERACITSNHCGTVKFAGKGCQHYRIVLAALKRFCRSAPRTITRRWDLAQQKLRRARYKAAFESTGIVYEIGEATSTASEHRRASSRRASKVVDIPRRPSIN